MQTFLRVSSKLISIISSAYNTQNITANTIPPTTGAGIQKVVKNFILSFKSTPIKSASTATATV